MAYKKATFKRFPERITDNIELPDMAELLTVPFVNCLTPEELYELGDKTLIRLYESCNLIGGYEYVYIDCYTQLLHPDRTAINVRTTGDYLHEWHIDGVHKIWDEKPSTFHILCSECVAKTMFNVNPVTVDLDETKSVFDLITTFNENIDEWGVEGKKMPSNSFVTFDTHLHNSTQPLSKEFRFFMRVIETDIKYENAKKVLNSSKITYLDGKRPVKVDSISKNGNVVKINIDLQHMKGVVKND
jgi:hypothetical protein